MVSARVYVCGDSLNVCLCVWCYAVMSAFPSPHQKRKGKGKARISLAEGERQDRKSPASSFTNNKHHHPLIPVAERQ